MIHSMPKIGGNKEQIFTQKKGDERFMESESWLSLII